MGLGVPGPLPKDPDQRLRRNKTGEDGIERENFNLDGEVEIPKAFFFNSYVNDIWLALKKSANVRFFEPTDWAYAKFTLKMVDDMVGEGEKFKMPSAQMMMTIDGMLDKLLLTEANRRRLKIEVKRNQPKDGELVNAEQLFRERFNQQREAN